MNTVKQEVQRLQEEYCVLAVVDLDEWNFDNYETSQQWLSDVIAGLKQDHYEVQDRIVLRKAKAMFMLKTLALV